MLSKASFEKMLRERVRCIVFDLDGTLVYVPREARHAITNATFAKVSDITVTKDEADGFWFGRDRDNILRRLGIEPEVFWAAFRGDDILEARNRAVRQYDDVAVLEKLSKRYALVALTNASRAIMKQNFEKFGLARFFRMSIHLEREVKKPHPLGIRKCLRELGLRPDETVMVGDADEDAIVARRNKVVAVLIEREERPRQVTPDYVIHGLEELVV